MRGAESIRCIRGAKGFVIPAKAGIQTAEL
jgi:hypothetical protein